MREAFGYHVKSISDHEHRELQPKEVYDIFVRDFVNISTLVNVENAVFTDVEGGREVRCEITYNGIKQEVVSAGNGRLDAVSNAIKQSTGIDYTFENYTQHALEGKTTSLAASYVSITGNGKSYYGAGVDSDIIVASIKALVSAINIMLSKK